MVSTSSEPRTYRRTRQPNRVGHGKRARKVESGTTFDNVTSDVTGIRNSKMSYSAGKLVTPSDEMVFLENDVARTLVVNAPRFRHIQVCRTRSARFLADSSYFLSFSRVK